MKDESTRVWVHVWVPLKIPRDQPRSTLAVSIGCSSKLVCWGRRDDSGIHHECQVKIVEWIRKWDDRDGILNFGSIIIKEQDLLLFT